MITTVTESTRTTLTKGARNQRAVRGVLNGAVGIVAALAMIPIGYLFTGISLEQRILMQFHPMRLRLRFQKTSKLCARLISMRQSCGDLKLAKH